MKEKFPHQLYRITLNLTVGEQPKAVVTCIPAKYTDAVATTAEGQRIKLNRLNTVELISKAGTFHMTRSYVAKEVDIHPAIKRMWESMRKDAERDLKIAQGLIACTSLAIVRKDRNYED